MPRYTEEDVARFPHLANVAIQWIVKYNGDFPFCVSMKRRVINGYHLSNSQIRGILNAMEYQEIESSPRPREPKVTNATFHASYVTARQSRVYHKIDSGFFVWHDDGRATLLVKPKCSRSKLRSPILLNSADILEPKIFEGDEVILQMCKHCAKR